MSSPIDPESRPMSRGGSSSDSSCGCVLGVVLVLRRLLAHSPGCRRVVERSASLFHHRHGDVFVRVHSRSDGHRFS